jgi:hypothetical protein
MLPDATAPSLMQLPLPLTLPTARPHPPPSAEVTTRPDQVWGTLSPEVQAQIRQTWLKVLQEVVDHGREH